MDYYNIVWSSRKDGPGTRVVLFLQGCNLHCKWCHSPHSQCKTPPILFYKEYCRHCGNCAASCKAGKHIVTEGKHLFSRSNCTSCGKCILSCPNGALEYSFYHEEPSIVFEKLKPELLLLNNIGGITVSGGEPLLQYKEVKELLMLCKETGIHTTVETSGAVENKCFEEMFPYVDCWLFGLKQTDNALSKRMTGADFDTILTNLSFLAQKALDKIIIRTPIIAGFTDDVANIERIISIMHSKDLYNIQLLPCNPYTEYYYKAAGIAFDIKRNIIPSRSRLNYLLSCFNKNGITAVLVR